jgi:hypothetical protein
MNQTNGLTFFTQAIDGQIYGAGCLPSIWGFRNRSGRRRGQPWTLRDPHLNPFERTRAATGAPIPSPGGARTDDSVISAN